MSPLDDETRLATVERELDELKLKFNQMLTGMYVARWIVSFALAALAIAVSR